MVNKMPLCRKRSAIKSCDSHSCQCSPNPSNFSVHCMLCCNRRIIDPGMLLAKYDGDLTMKQKQSLTVFWKLPQAVRKVQTALEDVKEQKASIPMCCFWFS